MSEYHSRIFGKVRDPDKLEKHQMNLLIETCPVAVFQELNKRLNSMGYCIFISLVGKERIDIVEP
jgi:ferredoxin-like protein FixX